MSLGTSPIQVQEMGKKMSTLEELMEKYAAELTQEMAIKSARVKVAFMRALRHRPIEQIYLPDEKGPYACGGQRFCKVCFDPQNADPKLLKYIYSDQPILIKLAPSSSSSRPSLVAIMLELLELEGGMRVLEIGAGTGYNAALMQELVGKSGRVVSIDIQPDFVERIRGLLPPAGYPQITMVMGDGAFGHPEGAPYDRIVATVGCPDISLCWAKQLAPTGFMLIPLQHGPEGADPLIRIWEEGRASWGNASTGPGS